MNAKQVLGFLVLKPAFSQRNLTSMLLVGVFFATYVMMGGKVTTEAPQRAATEEATTTAAPESSLANDSATQAAEKKGDPLEVLGIKLNKEQKDRQRALLGKGQLSDDERASEETSSLNKDSLQVTSKKPKETELEKKIAKSKNFDSLSAIEDRLKIRKNGQ